MPYLKYRFFLSTPNKEAQAQIPGGVTCSML